MSTKASAIASANLREDLRRRNLKWNWDSIAADCVANPELLPCLLGFCTDAEVVLQQNAGAVLGKIIDLDRDILIPHLPTMLKNLKSELHDAVKRATMRVLERIEIPKEIEGEAFDVATQFLSDFNEAIAIRAYSMTVARRICQRYPSLRHEILPIIRGFLEHETSAGIVARAKNELKHLEKLKDSTEIEAII